LRAISGSPSFSVRKKRLVRPSLSAQKSTLFSEQNSAIASMKPLSFNQLAISILQIKKDAFVCSNSAAAYSSCKKLSLHLSSFSSIIMRLWHIPIA
jgi:hypothetical protein